MASIIIGCEEICVELQSVLDGKRSEPKYRVVLAVSYTREAMEGYKHGFYYLFSKDTKRE